MKDSSVKDLGGFCSAPWTDAIAYANGELKACDRCVLSFGNWQKEGLEKLWRGEKLQSFRAEIAQGRYPHEDCRSCHNNGTQRTAASSLRSAYFVHQTVIRKHFGMLPAIEELPKAFFQQKRSSETDALLSGFFQELERLRADLPLELRGDSELERALKKLCVIGESLEDYLNASLIPRRVATFRQAQLQAKCTARCVMCAGKFTGEIVDGPTMDSEHASEAFAAIEDVTDFWCNGAEYLFYKDWKKVALMLAQEGVKTRISTNGILLTEDAVRFLVDKQVLDLLTVSMDAASKEMLESIRINVKFEALLERLHFLFRYAREKQYYFQFTASFVMMRKNLHELPEFIRSIRRIAGDDYSPPLTVLCQPLENFSIPEYRSFVHQEHHALIGEDRLKKIFLAASEAGKANRIIVRFYNQTLDDFIAQGMQFPRFFPKELDAELFLKSANTFVDRFIAENPLTERSSAKKMYETWQGALSPLSTVIYERFPALKPSVDSLLQKKAEALAESN
jgi:radical SAM protein with 4Fe4S-binding SPASM domain